MNRKWLARLMASAAWGWWTLAWLCIQADKSAIFAPWFPKMGAMVSGYIQPLMAAVVAIIASFISGILFCLAMVFAEEFLKWFFLDRIPCSVRAMRHVGLWPQRRVENGAPATIEFTLPTAKG